MLAISLIGFADASFIAYEHLQGVIPPCTVLNGCENVLTSEFSSIGPIRLEWLGVAYYLTIFVLLVSYLDTKKPILVINSSRIAIIGMLASIVLVYLQVFVIKSLCLYCLVSAATSTALFVLGLIFLIKYARRNP